MESNSSKRNSTKWRWFNLLVYIFVCALVYGATTLNLISDTLALGVLYALLVCCNLCAAVIQLLKSEFKSAANFLILSAVWSLPIYFTYSGLIEKIHKARNTYASEDPKCSEGVYESCHKIANDFYDLGIKFYGTRYYLASCFLGGETSCAHLNEILKRDFEFSNSIYTKSSSHLCTQGVEYACVQEAKIYIQNHNRDKIPAAIETLNNACEKELASACDGLGEFYLKSNLFESKEFYDKACKLDYRYCYKRDSICFNGLYHHWKKYEEQGVLDEAIDLCMEICQNKNYTCRALDSVNEDLGRMHEEKGNLLEAAKYYAKICALGRTEYSCSKKRFICGNVSIDKFLKTNPTAEEKSKVLELCSEYCDAGISNACGGLSQYYHHDKNSYEELMYADKECLQDQDYCTTYLEHKCKFNISSIIKEHPDKEESIKLVCGKYL